MAQNRATYISVMILAIAFLFFRTSSIAYMTLYAVLILPISSLLISLLFRFFVDVSQFAEKEVIKNDYYIIKLKIKNRSFLSFSHIHVHILGHYDENGYSLQPKQTIELDIPVKATIRGTQYVGAKRVGYVDLLGLFKLKFVLHEKLKITVFPQVIELETFPTPSELAMEQSNFTAGQEDYANVSDIRKYQPSDGYKNIHWKVTAKRNELYVKSYEILSNHTTRIYIDTQIDMPQEIKAEMEDKLVESAVAVVNHYLKREIPVEVTCFRETNESFLSRNISGFYDLYRHFAELTFDGEKDFATSLAMELFSLERSNVILLSHHMTENLFNVISDAKVKEHRIFCIFCVETRESMQMVESIQAMGIPCFVVSLDDDIAEILH